MSDNSKINKFDEAFTKWLKWLENEKRVSSNTIDAYRGDLLKWKSFSKNTINPKRSDFRDFMAKMMGKSFHLLFKDCWLRCSIVNAHDDDLYKQGHENKYGIAREVSDAKKGILKTN